MTIAAAISSKYLTWRRKDADDVGYKSFRRISFHNKELGNVGLV